jgi:4-hydroxybenzoate polyprenyltransferase
MNWIKAIRPLNTALIGIIIALSFRLAHNTLEGIGCAAATCVTYAATIAWNDYWDRVSDARRGKRFALEHSRQFLVYACALWLAALTCSILLFTKDSKQAGLLKFALITCGLLYPLAEQSWFFKNISVAISIASIVTFPVLKGHSEVRLLSSFLILALANYAREVTKDLEDHSYDDGLKSTIVTNFGEMPAISCAITAIVATAYAALTKIPFLGLVMLPFLAYAAWLLQQNNYRKAQQWLKASTVSFLIVLFWF